MKILIIGGTGTISTPITSALAQNTQNEVYVLNRGNHNDRLHPNIISLIGDINDKEAISSLIKEMTFDTVINFILFTPAQAYDNIALFKGKTKQFIFISTVVTYNHDGAVCFNEDHPLGNRYSHYGQGKQACEEIFRKAYQEEGFPITIVRPSQTYSNDRIPLSIKGKNCYSVIKRMLEGKEVIIHGDGNSLWTCTHADDFAKGFVPLVGNLDTINEAYQIVSDEQVSWNMIYLYLAKLLNVPFKPVYMTTDLLSKSKTYSLSESIQGDKQFSHLFDTTKIKQAAPDFECAITIEKGLAMYLDYMEKHPELKQADEKFDQWCDQVIAAYKLAMKSVEEVL
ncbi:MAG: NAD-dependent epimerase/dehydratase family protein [Beduini sp.]|uniref:NAD-dependent epimerase/dehydratase family protein n=1 Tax=Beduini sp. TaxID=1922300 RepID=UPI0011C9E5F0